VIRHYHRLRRGDKPGQKPLRLEPEQLFLLGFEFLFRDDALVFEAGQAF
jgi:hypothetical protein